MKALLCRPERPLLTRDHPTPRPAPGEALIRVLLAGEGGCPVTLLGRHRDKLALAAGAAPGTVDTVHTDHWRPPAPLERFPLVVEASGSANGLSTAVAAARPGGTLVLKSTLAAGAPQNLTPLVVDEITLIGSRCGPFPAALASMARHRYPLDRLVSARYPLSRGVEAFAEASRPGSLKVLVDPAA
jgi:threonine dehydrogenase-like Zn-dependent dehydrogenase